MQTSTLDLDQVRVASPCRASWNDMDGNDRVRHCRQCRMRVYNLSALSRVQAQELIEHTEGRLCVRYYQRADGTVLTRDCPVGWAAMKRRLTWIGMVAAACLALVAGTWVWAFAASNHDDQHGRGDMTIRELLVRLFGAPRPVMVMGEICPAPVPPGVPFDPAINEQPLEAQP